MTEDTQRANRLDTTIDRRQLAQQIASKTTGVTETQVYDLLGTLTDVITDNLQRGYTVALKGFGTWKPTERAARKGMNIRTKERIDIPAKRSANFQLGTTLRSALAGGAAGGGTTRATTRGSGNRGTSGGRGRK